jgi:FSR family fosmidomycin resistance protein-like MFS transporter
MSFKISREVKIVSWSTAILWFGWGFGESLIPVFLYQFSNSYAETGLLKSVFDISALLFTPIIGYYADKVSIKKMMLVGISLYFLIAINYYLAGVFAVALFIVIARILNGISWPLTCVSRESYICKYSDQKHMARAFGYFDTLGILAWVSAVVLSLFLVEKFAIHQLLFLIAPAALISLIIAWFLPSGPKFKKIKSVKFNLRPYREVIKEIWRWPAKLRILILSSFLISLVSTAFFFFVPIEVWKTGSDLKQIIILAIFYSLPEASGNLLGWVIDKIKVSHSLFFSFLGSVIVIIGSIFWTSFLWRLAALILVGIFMETISLSRRQLIADFNVKNNFGLFKTRYSFGGISAILDEITSFGGFAGVILAGALIDLVSWSVALWFLVAVLVFVVGIFFKKGIIKREEIV